MHSARVRLATALGASLIGLLLVLGLVFHFMLRQAVEDHMRLRLDGDVEQLITTLRFPQDGGLYLPFHRLDPAFQRAGSGRYFQIVSQEHGELRSPSLQAARLPIPDVPAGDRAVTRKVTGADETPLLLRAHRISREGDSILILVAEDYTPVLTATRRWQAAFLLLTILGSIAALLVQHWLLRRSFAPMEQIRDELDALGQGRLRQLSVDVPSEIHPLVEALNRLLRVMDERIRRSRRAAGDLAHALKTPLSGLQVLLDRPEVHALPQSRELQKGLETMRDRIQRELRRAHVMGGTVPGAHFRPETDLGDLIGTLKRIYRDKELEIETRITLRQPIIADREDMLELIGNLLDNACKWAGKRIRLEVESTNEGWSLCIADDGPGVSSEDFPLLTQRGQRLDEQTPGSGLGLAIVHDVIEVYQGTLHWDRDAELGGLYARLFFPA